MSATVPDKLLNKIDKSKIPNHVAVMDERIKEFPDDIEMQFTQKHFAGDEKKFYRFHNEN